MHLHDLHYFLSTVYLGRYFIMFFVFIYYIVVNKDEYYNKCIIHVHMGISLPSVVLRRRTDTFEHKFSLCADLVKALA